MDSSTLLQIFGRNLTPPSSPLTGQITGEQTIPGYSNPLTGQLAGPTLSPTSGSSSSPFFMPGTEGSNGIMRPDVAAASAPGQPGLQNQLNKSAAVLNASNRRTTGAYPGIGGVGGSTF